MTCVFRFFLHLKGSFLFSLTNQLLAKLLNQPLSSALSLSLQACIDENADLVELLVNRGAYLDATDDEGWTPLHAAASAGNVEIAQLVCLS